MWGVARQTERGEMPELTLDDVPRVAKAALRPLRWKQSGWQRRWRAAVLRALAGRDGKLPRSIDARPERVNRPYWDAVRRGLARYGIRASLRSLRKLGTKYKHVGGAWAAAGYCNDKSPRLTGKV